MARFRRVVAPLCARLDVARIARDIDVAQYDKTLQAAFREVADALDAQRAFYEASSQVLRLSTARYRTGIDSYLDVLVAQRSFYTAGQTLITLQLAEQSNRIALYKVMGGGWN